MKNFLAFKLVTQKKDSGQSDRCESAILFALHMSVLNVSVTIFCALNFCLASPMLNLSYSQSDQL